MKRHFIRRAKNRVEALQQQIQNLGQEKSRRDESIQKLEEQVRKSQQAEAEYRSQYHIV